jgi:hypothetical protein
LQRPEKRGILMCNMSRFYKMDEEEKKKKIIGKAGK